MGDKTNIEWTDATWNPITGCSKVSAGCDHCYAEGIAHRFAGTSAYPRGFDVTLRPERLEQPLRWTRPRRVFVNSMSDLFHKDVPSEYIARVFAVMALTPQHTYQVLTKRPGRIRSLLTSPAFRQAVWDAMRAHHRAEIARAPGPHPFPASLAWPLQNVWMGVSAEDQTWWDVRIPVLMDTPAVVHFVSAEPLLGPIRLHLERGNPVPEWVIVGGESGPHARPIDAQWVRDIRDDSTAAGAAFFFKQWGGLRAKANGRELDGRTWEQYPTVPGARP